MRERNRERESRAHSEGTRLATPRNGEPRMAVAINGNVFEYKSIVETETFVYHERFYRQ